MGKNRDAVREAPFDADRDNGVQIVVLGVVGFAVGGSYPEFPDN
jgi:hypothetical protein